MAFARADGYALEFLLPTELLVSARMQPGTTVGCHFMVFNDGLHEEQFVACPSRCFRKPYALGALRLTD